MGNLWPPAFKEGVKVEHAEFVLASSDHSVTTTHGDEGTTRAVGKARAEGDLLEARRI
jgi:hypothetical protein